MIIDVLKDAGLDSVKLLPFLFATYMLMEYLEHKKVLTAGKLAGFSKKAGPLFGGLFGVFPQCGFSAAASSMYAGRVITMGTLIAVYLSTSDEMLPMFLSSDARLSLLIAVLAGKAAIGILMGFAVDIIYRKLHKNEETKADIHAMCEHEHCNCEDGILKSAARHTIKIFLFVLIISIGINLVVELVGEESLRSFFTSVPVLGQTVSALVGLIPNCAASVIITKLYLENVISIGVMMSGLLVGAGVGLLVLFRLNHNKKDSLKITGILWVTGIFWGVIIDLVLGILR